MPMLVRASVMVGPAQGAHLALGCEGVVMTAFQEHEDWRRKTKGAMEVIVTRGTLVDLVVGNRLPWEEDQYIGAMRRLYLTAGVSCPIEICRAYVRELVPKEYIRARA